VSGPRPRRRSQPASPRHSPTGGGDRHPALYLDGRCRAHANAPLPQQPVCIHHRHGGCTPGVGQATLKRSAEVLTVEDCDCLALHISFAVLAWELICLSMMGERPVRMALSSPLYDARLPHGFPTDVPSVWRDSLQPPRSSLSSAHCSCPSARRRGTRSLRSPLTLLPRWMTRALGMEIAERR